VDVKENPTQGLPLATLQQQKAAGSGTGLPIVFFETV
jgi:hypothetical protein